MLKSTSRRELATRRWLALDRCYTLKPFKPIISVLLSHLHSGMYVVTLRFTLKLCHVEVTPPGGMLMFYWVARHKVSIGR